MTLDLQSFNYETVSLDDFGSVIERQRACAHGVSFELSPGNVVEMIKVPSASFVMGSAPDELGSRDSERPQHKVKTSTFYIARFPVTQRQWLAVMTSLPKIGERFLGDDLPVVNVWWEDALQFCERFSKFIGYSIRLPSEAEWEYACRAGTTTPFHWGHSITSEVANFDGAKPYKSSVVGDFRERLTPVGSFGVANGFGLYDMHGNVWEWCSDIWHEDYVGAPVDGSAWDVGGDYGYRVQRGGSWIDSAVVCRSANRVGDIARNSDHIVGLRVCFD